MSPRFTFSCALALGLLVATSSTSRADQFQALGRRQAEVAAGQVKSGDWIFQWVSHMRQDAHFYRVTGVEVDYEDGYYELEATLEPHAVLKPSYDEDGILSWTVKPIPAEQVRPQTMALDLAYVYVLSRELPRTHVNLAKKLDLTSDFFPKGAHVKHLALSVPIEITKLMIQRLPLAEPKAPFFGKLRDGGTTQESEAEPTRGAAESVRQAE